MTRTQTEKRIEKLEGLITAKKDKRVQLAGELDQHRAEVKALREQLKAMPKPARKKTTAGSDSEE